jgi:hypothetical protein
VLAQGLDVGRVSEIERVARTDPALAGEDAVLLVEKLSPAVSQIDSSSGALGNAANGVVEKMAPLIAAAPVPESLREKWLDRLFEAIQKDDPPYIEPLCRRKPVANQATFKDAAAGLLQR